MLQGVDADAMEILLQSVNKKEIDILKSNDILSVLQASSMLQFESIQKTCVEMIVHQWLSVSTCLQTMAIAEELDLITLHHKAQALALWEFSQVKETDAFLELPIGYIEKYLGNDGVNAAQGEFEVFEAGLCWLQDKPEERKECVLRILDCIRFADVPLSDIKTMLLYPVIGENTDYVQIIQCIICIMEGKHPEEIFCIAESDAKTVTSRDSLQMDVEELLDGEMNSASEQKKAKQCSCSSKKDKVQMYVLNSCCCCCTSVKDITIPVKDSELIVETSHSTNSEILEEDQVRFTASTIMVARRLLSTPSRTLPLLPCVVGHKREWIDFQRRGSNDDNKGEKITAGGGKPYIIYYQKGKTQHPVPFLHLSKADEGPLEPTGYKVICKGKCLHKNCNKMGHGNSSILQGRI
jgi:hypothetical protein